MIRIRYVDKNVEIKEKNCETCFHRECCILSLQEDEIKKYFDCECKRYQLRYPIRDVTINNEDIEKQIISLIEKDK